MIRTLLPSLTKKTKRILHAPFADRMHRTCRSSTGAHASNRWARSHHRESSVSSSGTPSELPRRLVVGAVQSSRCDQLGSIEPAAAGLGTSTRGCELGRRADCREALDFNACSIAGRQSPANHSPACKGDERFGPASGRVDQCFCCWVLRNQCRSVF